MCGLHTRPPSSPDGLVAHDVKLSLHVSRSCGVNSACFGLVRYGFGRCQVYVRGWEISGSWRTLRCSKHRRTAAWTSQWRRGSTGRRGCRRGTCGRCSSADTWSRNTRAPEDKTHQLSHTPQFYNQYKVGTIIFVYWAFTRFTILSILFILYLCKYSSVQLL